MVARPKGTNSARVIQVIETKSTRGWGTDKDPVREVTQYWDLDGNFLAEMDKQHILPLVNYETEEMGSIISHLQMRETASETESSDSM